jgi:hypothetical protein
MRRAFGFALLALLLVTTSAAWQLGAFAPRPIISAHQGLEAYFRTDVLGGLPDTINALFYGSGKCAGCHGEDPNDLASLAGQTFPMQAMPEGWDVNVVDDWRSSIMANSTKDPFWRAKVRHEVITNPGHAAELEDKCTSCHAPVGHFAAHHEGAEYYTLLEALTDSLALDGVNCAVCHQQDPEGIGTRFSGEMTFVEDTIFGPYGGGKDEYPVQYQPMQSFIGFYPTYGEHMTQSESCAACHSLITSSVDLEGEYTGFTVIEQATYHEWVNSVYSSGPEQQECQGCHMPQIDDPVTIASGYAWLQPRSPFALHYFVGANTHMLRMLRNNVDSLGLSATEAQFDSTLDRTLKMLEEQTLELNATSSILEDQLSVQVDLLNKAGHKFPSGYPARRAWIELQVTDAEGQSLFHSGAWNPETGHIIGQENTGWEPHHDIITDDEDVVIYELVLGDVNGDPTTLLERAHAHLKDNRLVPRGFSTSHLVYDTTEVVGAALIDPNFNFNAAAGEGTGTDQVTYILSEGWNETSELHFECTVWYQSLPPKWVAPMLEIQGDSLIDGFRSLYAEFAPSPERIASVEWSETISEIREDISQNSLYAFPNPSRDGLVNLTSKSPFGAYALFDAAGRRVEEGQCANRQLRVALPTSGSYIFKSESGMLRLQRH